MKQLNCWKCNAGMKRIKDSFQGFKIDAWECPKCKDIVYDGRYSADIKLQ